MVDVFSKAIQACRQFRIYYGVDSRASAEVSNTFEDYDDNNKKRTVRQCETDTDGQLHSDQSRGISTR